MKSMLGLRGKSPKASPLETGAFRALHAESELHQLGKSEWWLWFFACAVTFLSAAALALSFVPRFFVHSNHFYEIRADQAQWGTAGLLVVFNFWLVYRQGTFRRARKHFTAAQNPFPDRTDDEISSSSGFDPVTGLYTRSSIEQHLGKEIGRSRRQNFALSLATIHIEEFSQLTQRYGKAAVDASLKEFARRMKKAIRGSDFAVRLNSGDFLLVLPECTLGEVKLILNRVGPLEFVSAGEKIAAPYSTGWVDYQPGENPSDLLKRATHLLHLYENAAKDSNATLIAS